MKPGKKKVLLTGGSGMVGKNILEHPAASAHDLYAPGRAELDLSDFGAVKAFVGKLKPDIVVHAAGRVGGIQANMAHPAAFLLENLDMGRNIVLASAQCGVGKLLNLGSSCMYPRNAPSPIAEDMLLKGELEPTNEGYAIAKVAVSRLCSYLSRENPGVSYKTVIPCNLYGRWDKFSPEHSHMIPAVIRKLHEAKAGGLKSVEIWGDGTARREFMYAGDVADCVHMALDRFETMPEIMNIGPGTDHTVDEYYRAVAGVVGYAGAFTHDLSRPVGMQRKLVDSSRAAVWGWKAATSLEKGLRACYEFYKDVHGDAK